MFNGGFAERDRRFFMDKRSFAQLFFFVRAGLKNPVRLVKLFRKFAGL
jgi:hypothetical protein